MQYTELTRHLDCVYIGLFVVLLQFVCAPAVGTIIYNIKYIKNINLQFLKLSIYLIVFSGLKKYKKVKFLFFLQNMIFVQIQSKIQIFIFS